ADALVEEALGHDLRVADRRLEVVRCLHRTDAAVADVHHAQEWQVVPYGALERTHRVFRNRGSHHGAVAALGQSSEHPCLQRLCECLYRPYGRSWRVRLPANAFAQVQATNRCDLPCSDRAITTIWGLP